MTFFISAQYENNTTVLTRLHCVINVSSEDREQIDSASTPFAAIKHNMKTMHYNVKHKMTDIVSATCRDVMEPAIISCAKSIEFLAQSKSVLGITATAIQLSYLQVAQPPHRD